MLREEKIIRLDEVRPNLLQPLFWLEEDWANAKWIPENITFKKGDAVMVMLWDGPREFTITEPRRGEDEENEYRLQCHQGIWFALVIPKKTSYMR